MQFDLEARRYWVDVVYFIQLAYLLEIVVQFVSCHIDNNNNLIYDSKAIVKYYLKEWFVLDLISSIPPEVMLPYGDDDVLFSDLDYLHLLKYIKVVKFFLYSTRIHYISNTEITK
jgi:hypothetical protein